MSEIPEDIKAATKAVIDMCTPTSSCGCCASYDNAIARAILAERKRCADIATAELRNTSQLLSNQPLSSAAWDIRNAIESGQ
jgi:hypothetical protein